ncbi:MAG: PAS-domain containing protein, partial [Rhizobiales bacterium]|nr:PAS-domain containing protein [Hyphomicrobiales bacterium]
MDTTNHGSNRIDDSVDPTAMLVEAFGRMPFGVSVWSLDHRLLYWNDAYLSLYRTPPDLVRHGMTLRERLSLSFLEHPISDERFDLIVARHESRLAEARASGGPLVRVDRVGGVTVERTYLECPGLGYVVIHVDETAQLDREAAMRAHN